MRQINYEYFDIVGGKFRCILSDIGKTNFDECLKVTQS